MNAAAVLEGAEYRLMRREAERDRKIRGALSSSLLRPSVSWTLSEVPSMS